MCICAKNRNHTPLYPIMHDGIFKGSFPVEDEGEYIKSGKSIFKGNFVQKVIF